MLKLKIPPPVYALLTALIMWGLARIAPIATVLAEPWNKAGLILVVLAALIDFSSLYLFLTKKTTPNPMKPQFTTGLVTTGMYKVSRNPMYLGLLILLLGVATYLGQLSAFLVLPVFCIVITEMQIKPEEHMLEQKFGSEYLAYKSKVRRWI